MTPTQIQLLAVYGGPAVPLADICKEHFNVGLTEAKRRAALHELPVPAFRLSDSQKAPWMVLVADLAEHIDKQAQEAKTAWEKSQV